MRHFIQIQNPHTVVSKLNFHPFTIILFQFPFFLGFLLISSTSCFCRSGLKPDENEPYLYHGTPEAMQEILQQSSNFDIYICGKHGKSRHLGLWNYNKMKLSNENLYRLNPDILNSLSEWVVPEEGGHLSQLCGKAVLLYTGDQHNP
jgi:hypothetical protein